MNNISNVNAVEDNKSLNAEIQEKERVAKEHF